MALNLADEIPIEDVKKVINFFLKELKTQDFTLFSNKPTVEVFFKDRDFLGVSLIDENNGEINSYLADDTPNYVNQD